MTGVVEAPPRWALGLQRGATRTRPGRARGPRPPSGRDGAPPSRRTDRRRGSCRRRRGRRRGGRHRRRRRRPGLLGPPRRRRCAGCVESDLRYGEAAAMTVRWVDVLRRRVEVAESVTEVQGRLAGRWELRRTGAAPRASSRRPTGALRAADLRCHDTSGPRGDRTHNPRIKRITEFRSGKSMLGHRPCSGDVCGEPHMSLNEPGRARLATTLASAPPRPSVGWSRASRQLPGGLQWLDGGTKPGLLALARPKPGRARSAAANASAAWTERSMGSHVADVDAGDLDYATVMAARSALTRASMATAVPAMDVPWVTTTARLIVVCRPATPTAKSPGL